MLPAYGVYCRHVSGLRLHNLDLSCEEVDARPAIVADDVCQLDVFGLNATLGANASSLLRLINVRGALLHGCRLAEKLDAFLAVTGKACSGIALRGNDLRNATRAVDTTDDVPANAVSQ